MIENFLLSHIEFVFQLQTAVFLLAMAGFLWLQTVAARRHKHRFFWLLVFSSVCGICSLIANGIALALPPNVSALLWCYALGFALAVGQLSLGLVGTFLLFKDYKRLADHFTKTTSGKPDA